MFRVTQLRVLSRARMHFRSTRPDVFCQKGVPGNFAKFPGKQLCQKLSFLILQFFLKSVSGTGVFL